MKALVRYDYENYLVRLDDSGSVDYDELFHLINKDRWPDECHPYEWIVDGASVLARFTDESQLVE